MSASAAAKRPDVEASEASRVRPVEQIASGVPLLMDKAPTFRARLCCLVRSRHDWRRHPLGGFRCRSCGAVKATWEGGTWEER